MYVVIFVVMCIICMIVYLSSVERFENSPYGTRMTKKKGESCEVPDECESLACSGHMGNEDHKTCAY